MVNFEISTYLHISYVIYSDLQGFYFHEIMQPTTVCIFGSNVSLAT